MTKHESIEQAYGSHWEDVKEFVDSEGWVNFKHLKQNLEIAFDAYADLVRPSSLHRLEYNNGWTKIESVDDLPKETMACYFILKSNKAMLSGYFRNGCFDYALRYYDENDVTHYQPIITPEPPIY